MSDCKNNLFTFFAGPTVRRDYVDILPTQRMSSFTVRLATSILLLLASRCPTTISRSVVSVVVGPAVESVMSRALPHVREESGKTIAPLTANGNSSAPIILVTNVAGVKASSLHVLPRTVFARRAFVGGIPVLDHYPIVSGRIEELK